MYINQVDLIGNLIQIGFQLKATLCVLKHWAKKESRVYISV